MKSLKDYEEDINKCSKCGLCQSVCPVYKITGNDCAVSRGKFIMLKGVLDGDLELNKNIEKYLDLCLKCGKCTEFCPSGIDVVKIFETAKYEYLSPTIQGKIINLLQSYPIFGTGMNIAKTIIPRKKFTKKGTIKLLYFKGCVNNVYPKVENTVKNILQNFDVEIIEKNFDCCGLPFLSSGNLERYEECEKHNSKLLNCDYDYILTDCASCADTISKYPDAKNVINIVEFLIMHTEKFVFENTVKVTFHKPCHMKNTDFLKPLIGKCENIEYIEMNEWDECCGFAGEFAIRNNKISRQLGAKKAQNIINTNADYVLTTCPACIMGLNMGLNSIQRNKTVKVLNIAELLAKAAYIKPINQ